MSYIGQDGTCHYEPVVPSDEIWYTTTDGNAITPYTKFIKDVDGNSLTIISNTYNDGKGIINFNKTIGILDGNYKNDNGEGAFHMKITLSAVILPDTITISKFLIGDNVKSIGENAFVYSDITDLTINQTEPPLLAKQEAFGMDIEGTPQPITIHVPSESVDKYKTADGWKDYADKIQAIS